MRISKQAEKEIRSLETKAGKIYAKSVLEMAKNPESILHKYFDWSDTSAANKYRLIQAAELIRCVRIESECVETEVRCVQYVSTPGKKEGGEYTSIGRTDDPMLLVEEMQRLIGVANRVLAIAKERKCKEIRYIRDIVFAAEKALKRL